MKKFGIGFGLFAIAVILITPLAIWGILESLWAMFYKRKIGKGFGLLGNLFRTLAFLMDVLVNVLMKHPFSRILTSDKHHEPYPFGYYRDTISYALGRNQIKGTLSPTGLWLCNLLDKFEKDHCIKTVKDRQGWK